MLSSVVQGESWIWCCRAKPGKEPYQLVGGWVGRDFCTIKLTCLYISTSVSAYIQCNSTIVFAVMSSLPQLCMRTPASGVSEEVTICIPQ